MTSTERGRSVRTSLRGSAGRQEVRKSGISAFAVGLPQWRIGRVETADVTVGLTSPARQIEITGRSYAIPRLRLRRGRARDMIAAGALLEEFA